MKDEYIIINKTQHEDRLRKLIEERDREPDNHTQSYLNGKIIMLEAIFSQSIPLISELEKAFDEGTGVSYDKSKPLNKWFINVDRKKENYISNLKLNI
jgi:hypothetical protein